jgi:SAM-dependent methyltransferase
MSGWPGGTSATGRSFFDPAVIDPAVDFLAGLAGAAGTRALELGVGTGRIALPLSRRGIAVQGIELSPAMAARLRAQPGGDAIGITVGDFASVRVDATFGLVYLVRNTITNLTTQDEQVACFRNAAAHLEPGGCFVIEVYIPALWQLPPGQTIRPFTSFTAAEAQPGSDTLSASRSTTWRRRSPSRTTAG